MPTFDAPGPVTLTIERGLAADVTLTASDRTDATVEVGPRDPGRAADVTAAQQVQVERSGTDITLRAPGVWSRLRGPNGVADVRIELPTGSRVETNLAMGHLRVEGELGPCRLRTAMGDLRVDRVASLHARTSFGDVTVDQVDGDVDVTAGSGELRLGVVAGTVVAKNGNGPTWIGAAAGDVQVKASNGDVHVGRAGASLTAKSACGDVRIGEVARGKTTLQTATGSLTVGVAAGTTAWLDASSDYGRVRSSLDPADAPTDDGPTVEVFAHTAMGDIDILRVAPASLTDDPAT